MSNNKNYYGWIHSLKQASIDAQAKGHQMRNLNETTGEDDSGDGDMSSAIPGSLSAGRKGDPRRGKIVRHAYDPDTMQEIEQGAQVEGEPVPSAQHMMSAYSAARRAGMARDTRLTRAAERVTKPVMVDISKDLKPVLTDITGDGDVDGEDQAHHANMRARQLERQLRPFTSMELERDTDRVPGTFGSEIEPKFWDTSEFSQLQRLPSFNVPEQPVTQNFPPPMFSTPEAANAEVARLNAIMKQQRKSGEVRESVNDKISRFLRG